MGRCRALLAHGTGVLVGDGEGTGLGLGRGLGDRGGGGVNESVGVGGPEAGGVTARRGEGEAGRVGARRLGGSVPGITGLVVGCPAVGAGLAEGDGPTQQVRGAVDGRGDQPLILLGGGHVAALVGQLDAEVIGRRGRLGQGPCGRVGSRLLGIAGGGGLRLSNSGNRTQRIGRQAHESVSTGGPAGGGRGGGAGRWGLQRARCGVGTGCRAGGLAECLRDLGSLGSPGGVRRNGGVCAVGGPVRCPGPGRLDAPPETLGSTGIGVGIEGAAAAKDERAGASSGEAGEGVGVMGGSEVGTTGGAAADASPPVKEEPAKSGTSETRGARQSRRGAHRRAPPVRRRPPGKLRRRGDA